MYLVACNAHHRFFGIRLDTEITLDKTIFSREIKDFLKCVYSQIGYHVAERSLFMSN